MSRFAVTPTELEAAASTLQAARGELLRSGGAGIGAGTGAGALEAALASVAARAELVGRLLDAAATAAGQNLAAGADAYRQTDEGAVREEWV